LHASKPTLGASFICLVAERICSIDHGEDLIAIGPDERHELIFAIRYATLKRLTAGITPSEPRPLDREARPTIDPQ